MNDIGLIKWSGKVKGERWKVDRSSATCKQILGCIIVWYAVDGDGDGDGVVDGSISGMAPSQSDIRRWNGLSR